MTVICVRDGIMAADSSQWIDDLTFTTAEKIVRLPDGSLIAGSGYMTDVDALIEYLQEHWAIGLERGAVEFMGSGDNAPEWLWLRPEGLWDIQSDCRMREITEPFAAIGSHVRFCMGLMDMGATAEQAVLKAVERGAWARGPVVVRRLDE